VVTYGYLAVALFVAAESIGVPAPGETVLIVAAIYAGHTHHLSPWIIFLTAAAAAIVGDNIGYWVGDKVGYRLVRRYGARLRIDQSKLKIGRYLFDRHGGKVVFFGRFISVLRTYAAFLAGSNRMDWRKFVAYNAAGGIVWAAVYTLLAYVVGDAFRKSSGTINVMLAAAAVVAIVTGILVLRRQASKLAARAELAYPGTLS